jgi:SAM-dependent methyltransferase
MRSIIPVRRQALVFGSLDGSIEAQAIDPGWGDGSSSCVPGRFDVEDQLVDSLEPGLPDKAAERGHPSYVWRAGQERRFQMVRRWAPLRHCRVLDVGCGMGLYTDAFRRDTPHVFGVEIEYERAGRAGGAAAGIAQATGERLPFSDAVFDVVFSHEVLEHVADDRICAEEMIRVARPGGRIVIFVPNRLYGFETHGVFWHGRYRFGNIPGVNWLPKRLRDRLAPHVRAYTGRDLRRLMDGLPVRLIHHTQIYPGYDNIAARAPVLGQLVRSITYALEGTPLRLFGLSHLLVLERVLS